MLFGRKISLSIQDTYFLGSDEKKRVVDLKNIAAFLH
jgi:hypothetical protein